MKILTDTFLETAEEMLNINNLRERYE